MNGTEVVGTNGQYRWGDPAVRRVVVVRALPGLGDLLCAVPALRALRHALPEAHVTLIGFNWARTFVKRFAHYLDDWIEFPGYPGITDRPLQVRRWPSFLAGVHARRFDLALQMHGNGCLTNPFTVLLGARANAGFYLPGQYCPDPELFLPYPDDVPEVWRPLRLMAWLGIPLRGDALEFPLVEEDYLALDTIDEARDLQAGAFVCVHPGARDPARRWPAARFAAVADALARQGLRVVLTGTAQEAHLTQAVLRAMAHGQAGNGRGERCVLDLAGRTNIGALAVLFSRARLVVCNDTGVSHLAAALRVPSAVIFCGTGGGSDPGRWAPLDLDLHRVVCVPGVPGVEGAAQAVRDVQGFCRGPQRLDLETTLAQVNELLRKERV